MIFVTVLKIHSSVSKFSKFIGNKSYYWVHDIAREENGEYSLYMKNQNGKYKKLKAFYECLKNEPSLKFLSVERRFINIHYVDIPNKFLFQYECSHPTGNENKCKKSLKCLHVSANVFSEFGMMVREDREFWGEGFHYTVGECVPIIWGV